MLNIIGAYLLVGLVLNLAAHAFLLPKGIWKNRPLHRSLLVLALDVALWPVSVPAGLVLYFNPRGL